jgi:transposase-like protein
MRLSSAAKLGICTSTNRSAASPGLAEKTRPSVFGALERGGKVRTAVLSNRKRAAIETEVRTRVETGSALYSDALQSYDGLAQEYAHKVIDHAEKYVDGQVHTNGLENFWSLLCTTGTSVAHVSRGSRRGNADRPQWLRCFQCKASSDN